MGLGKAADPSRGSSSDEDDDNDEFLAGKSSDKAHASPSNPKVWIWGLLGHRVQSLGSGPPRIQKLHTFRPKTLKSRTVSAGKRSVCCDFSALDSSSRSTIKRLLHDRPVDDAELLS